MLPYWIRFAVFAGIALVLLILIWVYLSAALPRMSFVVGLSCTAVLALLLLPGAVMWAGPGGRIMALGLSALVAGHLGWLFGQQAARSLLNSGRAKRPAGSILPSGLEHPLPPAAPTAPVVRTMLGRYRIERELGRGAMGTVYLGRDTNIGRAVAIKTMALSREFEGNELIEARRRFFREAETAGRLQHTDIVTIFDAGEDQELAYIAMEYLTGDDLQRYTQLENLLPVAVVLRIVARVADALAYAHTQGVVHRDIKPANVMVDLVSDLVKVTDFGIARIADASRTRTGMVLGTPSFMSPEQMAGLRVDGRSDLYSLGVMLFQLLTARLPHVADSMATLLHQIANDPAPDIRTVREGLPEPLARVVGKVLEKRSELRHADGFMLAVELRAVLDVLDGSEDVPSGKPLQSLPDSGEFQATVKLERADTMHNPTF